MPTFTCLLDSRRPPSSPENMLQSASHVTGSIATGRGCKRTLSNDYRPALRNATRAAAALNQCQFDIMQRASNYYVGSRRVFTDAVSPINSADWLYEEADAMSEQYPKDKRCGARDADELTSPHALGLIPYLSLNPDSVFVEVGRHCRGRLPLNLALNCKAKAFVSICPELQQAINASQLAGPIMQSTLIQAPITFTCSEPHLWHYQGATHVLLHNDSVSAEACRAVASKLAASPSFQLLITTTPLPFQHHLVHVGDSWLGSDGAPATLTIRAPRGSSAADDVGSARTLPEHSRCRPAEELGYEEVDEPLSMIKARSAMSALMDKPAGRTVYFYSTSFVAAPAGTLSKLYCQSGVCCLPGFAMQPASCASSSDAQQEAPSAIFPADSGRGSGALVRNLVLPWLPPLAAHTSTYLDLASSR